MECNTHWRHMTHITTPAPILYFTFYVSPHTYDVNTHIIMNWYLSPCQDTPALFSSTDAHQRPRKPAFYIMFTPSSPFRLLYRDYLACLYGMSGATDTKWHYPTWHGLFMFPLSGPLCLCHSQSSPHNVPKTKEWVSRLKPEEFLFHNKLICFAENTFYCQWSLSLLCPSFYTLNMHANIKHTQVSILSVEDEEFGHFPPHMTHVDSYFGSPCSFSAFGGNRSRPLWSELSELWDSQSILHLPLCLPLCVSHCSLALSTQWWRSCVVKSWEWTIRQQPYPLLSLQLMSLSLSAGSIQCSHVTLLTQSLSAIYSAE